ncbi:MAG: phosphodiester glycosidase family protein [Ferruginibacter sp.]|nr:phosphodiester glycosidase family protein [Ferruginibacter sp.]
MASLQKICWGVLLLKCFTTSAQVKWQNVDSNFQPLPKNFHIYKSTDSLDGKPFVAYYVSAKLKDKKLNFTTDTTYKRRLTPQQFFQKNNNPLLVVNGTFFSFETNQNLNVVVKEGKVLSHTVRKIKSRTDTTIVIDNPMVRSAIGISKKRKADVAWIKTDSSNSNVRAIQLPAINGHSVSFSVEGTTETIPVCFSSFSEWKVKTAIGGGPVLLQKGEISIANKEEEMFAGKSGLIDKHPRTAMGYTTDGNLIIMVVEGRNPNLADGVSLPQLAQLLKDIGCVEALNLDGGGSSCMLVNGKETIKPSDKTGQRPVPAVFIIQQKK